MPRKRDMKCGCRYKICLKINNMHIINVVVIVVAFAMFFFAFPNAFTILFYLNATNSIKSTAHRCICVRAFSRIILCFFSVYYFELFCVPCCGCCIRCVPVFISVCQCALKVSTHCPYIQCRVCARACVSFSGLLAKQYTP